MGLSSQTPNGVRYLQDNAFSGEIQEFSELIRILSIPSPPNLELIKTVDLILFFDFDFGSGFRSRIELSTNPRDGFRHRVHRNTLLRQGRILR